MAKKIKQAVGSFEGKEVYLAEIRWATGISYKPFGEDINEWSKDIGVFNGTIEELKGAGEKGKFCFVNKNVCQGNDYCSDECKCVSEEEEEGAAYYPPTQISRGVGYKLRCENCSAFLIHQEKIKGDMISKNYPDEIRCENCQVFNSFSKASLFFEGSEGGKPVIDFFLGKKEF